MLAHLHPCCQSHLHHASPACTAHRGRVVTKSVTVTFALEQEAHAPQESQQHKPGCSTRSTCMETYCERCGRCCSAPECPHPETELLHIPKPQPCIACQTQVGKALHGCNAVQHHCLPHQQCAAHCSSVLAQRTFAIGTGSISSGERLGGCTVPGLGTLGSAKAATPAELHTAVMLCERSAMCN
jgi:hypothetical protein